MQHGRQQLLPQAALLTEGRAALPQKVFSGLCRQRLLLKGKNRRSRGFAPEVRCEHLSYAGGVIFNLALTVCGQMSAVISEPCGHASYRS